jgi:glyoxylase-like metal-dependent hydrolase (beta-lactamase superfamily II)
MHGMQLPDVDSWSGRVTVALGQNPSAFTGPGTNTYLVGTGSRRILIDTGDGRPEYLPILDQALEKAGCTIQEIILTHGHIDHIGGVQSVHKRHGNCPVSKMPWPEIDTRYDFEISPLEDNCVIETEGARLHGIHTPGHAPDHLCFLLEQENTLFTGDNVLGVGTTIIPTETGDLAQYMNSLERLLEQQPVGIYPAHGPFIEDGVGKLREYIAHRWEREDQILSTLADGVHEIEAMVKIIYTGYPSFLYAAAGQSVGSHLLKLERESRVRREGKSKALPTEVSWYPKT